MNNGSATEQYIQIEKQLQKKRVAIYGTGIIAKALLTNATGLNVVGVLDRTRICGDICGFPIITWDEVRIYKPDAIVIAAKADNIDIILRRIVWNCTLYKLSIYDGCGQLIDIDEFKKKYIDFDTAVYLKKTKTQLKKEIDKNDVISFDLFDTLIVRKVLEPTDVFDIVEKKAKAQGMELHSFKGERRRAELMSKGSLAEIYKILAENCNLSDSDRDALMEKELEAEKEVIIARKDMHEIFEYARKKEKIVNIVSDMYLDSDVLKSFLGSTGYEGYNELLVSCEYGVSKGNGLFEIYKEKYKGRNLLHIGDDFETDIIPAIMSGINTYEIKSSYTLFLMSNFSNCMKLVTNADDKLFLGMIVSKLFNSPFSMCGSNGFLNVSQLRCYVECFISPVVGIYLRELLDFVSKEKYEGVLFAARDGNLLYKLYEYLRKKYKVSTEGKYLYTSRKAAVGANISDSELYEYALKYFGVEREKLCDLLEISSDRFEEEITQNRKHYYEYLDLLGIDINKKYVLCDLISSGTTLLYMNQMFKCKMRGFFLGYILTEDNTDKKEKDVFRNRFNGETQWYTNQLELFLTSPEASVKCFKPGGKVEFGKDIRTKRDISLLKKVQNTIYNDVVKNYSRYYSTDISKTLVFELFKYSKQVFINGNAKVLGECVLYDDTTTKIYRVFENIYE